MADPPIVDVPITGGVIYGTDPGAYTGIADDPGGGTQWGSYQWFDPISLFCNNPLVPQEDCLKFCRLCESQLVPQLVNMNTLPGSPIDFPEFTPANIQAYGVCQIFWIWMWSVFVSQATGVAENPITPPAPPESGGGGG